MSRRKWAAACTSSRQPQGRSLEPGFDDSTGYKFFVVPGPKLLEIMAPSPAPVPIIGKPGTVVVFFHPDILHASGHNLSAHDRWQVYLVYNRVSNRPDDVPAPRPDYVRSTNFVTAGGGPTRSQARPPPPRR